MAWEKIYIVDNIPLFNPVIGEGKILPYDDFAAGRAGCGFCPRIYFVTADIDSIIGVTDKIHNLFLQSGAVAMVLKDSKREKVITAWYLLRRLVKKRREERSLSRVISFAQDRIECLERRTVRKQYRKNAMPVYIKTTMSYGVQSGGMVAHSTGVLNALVRRYGQIPVYTTDYISSEVQTDEIHHISMKAYHDFGELRNLLKLRT